MRPLNATLSHSSCEIARVATRRLKDALHPPRCSNAFRWEVGGMHFLSSPPGIAVLGGNAASLLGRSRNTAAQAFAAPPAAAASARAAAGLLRAASLLRAFPSLPLTEAMKRCRALRTHLCLPQVASRRLLSSLFLGLGQ